MNPLNFFRSNAEQARRNTQGKEGGVMDECSRLIVKLQIENQILSDEKCRNGQHIAALERALELRENSEHFQWCKQRISELERQLAEAQEIIRNNDCAAANKKEGA